MLASAVIVFREVLEASLIIGIVLAATTGVAQRGRWVGLGVIAGLVGACVVALSAQHITEMAQGVGQELLNAGILLTAVAMLGWHQIWMGQHARSLAAEFKALGQGVQGGTRSLHALAIVVGAAILREGSEAVLFLFGVAASGSESHWNLIGGALLGLLGGAACGTALYAGLLKIPARKLFSVTGWMLTLLAAGMASQAAAFLVQTGYLPALIDEVWNTTWLLPRSSIVGQLLHILIGYDDRPSAMQCVFYASTVVVIVCVSRWVARPRLAVPSSTASTPTLPTT